MKGHLGGMSLKMERDGDCTMWTTPKFMYRYSCTHLNIVSGELMFLMQTFKKHSPSYLSLGQKRHLSHQWQCHLLQLVYLLWLINVHVKRINYRLGHILFVFTDCSEGFTYFTALKEHYTCCSPTLVNSRDIFDHLSYTHTCFTILFCWLLDWLN